MLKTNIKEAEGEPQQKNKLQQSGGGLKESW